VDSTKPKSPLKIDLRDGKERICPRCNQTSTQPYWRTTGTHSKKAWIVWDLDGPLLITFNMYYCGYCHEHFGDPKRYEYGPKQWSYTYLVLSHAWKLIQARLEAKKIGKSREYPHSLKDIAEKLGGRMGRKISPKVICDWQTELENIDDFHNKIEKLSMP